MMKRVHGLAVFLILSVLSVGIAVADDPPQDPLLTYYIRGTVTSTKSNPIRNCEIWLTMQRSYPALNVTYKVVTDQNGFYEYGTTHQDVSLDIRPVDSRFGIWHSPEEAIHETTRFDIEQNFKIWPGVLVTVETGIDYPSPAGTRVYAGNQHVATIPEGTHQVGFYPDHFSLPHSGYLSFSKPFHKFVPQSEGQFMAYDCTNTAIDKGPVPYQGIYSNPDTPGSYSWNIPGGTGWDKFPATPDNRMPNNPNVYVEVDFALDGLWLKENIRLNGNAALEDLSDANGHVARFMYPIENCGRSTYQLSVKYDVGYSPEWRPLTELLLSGTSNGDLTDDSAINMSDIIELNSALGQCEGDDGFLPCADYQPDGCIDVSDVPIFADIYYTDPGKTTITSNQGNVWFESVETNSMTCMFEAVEPWDVAIIRFEVPMLDALDLTWIPTDVFSGRSVMTSRENGNEIEFSLWLFGSGLAETTALGCVVTDARKGQLSVNVLSTEIGVGEGDKGSPEIPLHASTASLENASPNPFNPMTTIVFEIPNRMPVSLVIYDIAGRAVRTLIDYENIEAGRTEITWNGNNDDGMPLAGGVYLYRLDAGDHSETKRMTLLK